MCETLATRICQTLDYAITAHCHHLWWRESQEFCFLSCSLPPLWPFSITPSLLLCLLYSAILPSFLFLPGVRCFFASSLQRHHFLSAPLPISPSCCLVPDIPPSGPRLPPARWLPLIVTFFFSPSCPPLFLFMWPCIMQILICLSRFFSCWAFIIRYAICVPVCLCVLYFIFSTWQLPAVHSRLHLPASFTVYLVLICPGWKSGTYICLVKFKFWNETSKKQKNKN